MTLAEALYNHLTKFGVAELCWLLRAYGFGTDTYWSFNTKRKMTAFEIDCRYCGNSSVSGRFRFAGGPPPIYRFYWGSLAAVTTDRILLQYIKYNKPFKWLFLVNPQLPSLLDVIRGVMPNKLAKENKIWTPVTCSQSDFPMMQ